MEPLTIIILFINEIFNKNIVGIINNFNVYSMLFCLEYFQRGKKSASNVHQIETYSKCIHGINIQGITTLILLNPITE
jgi:hypothetical protein